MNFGMMGGMGMPGMMGGMNPMMGMGMPMGMPGAMNGMMTGFDMNGMGGYPHLCCKNCMYCQKVTTAEETTKFDMETTIGNHPLN